MNFFENTITTPDEKPKVSTKDLKPSQVGKTPSGRYAMKTDENTLVYLHTGRVEHGNLYVELTDELVIKSVRSLENEGKNL